MNSVTSAKDVGSKPMVVAAVSNLCRSWYSVSTWLSWAFDGSISGVLAKALKWFKSSFVISSSSDMILVSTNNFEKGSVDGL